MGKKRVHEIAKELNKDSKDIIATLKQHGVEVKSHMSTLSDEEEAVIRKAFAPKPAEKKPAAKPVVNRTVRVDIEKLDAKVVAEAMYQGDTFAKEVYLKCAEYLGRGLSIIIDIINPEAVVIGSIYERNQEFFSGIINDIIKKETLSFNADVCKILPAELGDSIGDFAALGVLF